MGDMVFNVWEAMAGFFQFTAVVGWNPNVRNVCLNESKYCLKSRTFKLKHNISRYIRYHPDEKGYIWDLRDILGLLSSYRQMRISGVHVM